MYPLAPSGRGGEGGREGEGVSLEDFVEEEFVDGEEEDFIED